MPHFQLYGAGQTLPSTSSPKGEQVFKVSLQYSSLFLKFLPSVLSICVAETLLRKPLCPMLLKCLSKLPRIQLSLQECFSYILQCPMYNDERHTLLSTIKNIDCRLLDVTETALIKTVLLMHTLIHRFLMQQLNTS